MKKLFFLCIIAIMAVSASAQYRSTEVTGSEDTSANRNMTDGVGKSTDKISFMEQPNGNVVTMVALRNDRNNIQGWVVAFHDKNGKELSSKFYARKKYQDAYEDARQDFYDQPRRGSGFVNIVRDIYRRSQGHGIVNGSRIVW